MRIRGQRRGYWTRQGSRSVHHTSTLHRSHAGFMSLSTLSVSGCLIVDLVCVQLVYSPTLRRHDAAVLVTGAAPSNNNLLLPSTLAIPPGLSSYDHISVCPSNATRAIFNNTSAAGQGKEGLSNVLKGEEIVSRVLYARLHMHNLGTGGEIQVRPPPFHQIALHRAIDCVFFLCIFGWKVCMTDALPLCGCDRWSVAKGRLWIRCFVGTTGIFTTSRACGSYRKAVTQPQGSHRETRLASAVPSTRRIERR